MKFKWNDDDQKYLKLGLTAFAVVVLSIIANQMLHQLPLINEGVKKFFSCLRPIAYGLIFAYILTPALNFFEKNIFRFGKKVLGQKILNQKSKKSRRFVRAVSIIIVWGLALLVISILLGTVIPELISSVNGIISNMPTYVNQLTDLISRVLKDNPEIRTMLIDQIRSSYRDFDSIIDSVSELIPNISEFVSNLSNGVFNAVSGVFNLAIGIIVSIYVMGAKESFVSITKKFTYGFFTVKRANELAEFARSAHKKFGYFFIGQFIDATIVGVLCALLLTIFQIPYAVLIGFIVGVTNIIPFFGPFIGAVPSGLLIFLVSPIKCLYFIIIIIVLQQIDGNIISPKILSNSIGISSFWVLFAILIFGGMFGFWGLLCGVPLFAVIYELISGFINRRLNEKKLPTVTADYRRLDHIDAETGEIINMKAKEDKNVSENQQDKNQGEG